MEKIWKPIVFKGEEWLEGKFRVSEYGDVERILKSGNIEVFLNWHEKRNRIAHLTVSTLTVNKSKKYKLDFIVVQAFHEIPDNCTLTRTDLINPELPLEQRYHYTNIKFNVKINKSKPKIKKILKVVPDKGKVTVPYYGLNENLTIISVCSGKPARRKMSKALKVIYKD